MANVICILGPPGAGKGTQANFLVKKYGMVTFSMGEALRQHNSAETNEILAKGLLVPAKLTVSILFEQIEAAGTADIVVDGFPRMMEQVRLLEPELVKTQHSLTAVVNLKVPRSESERRLNRRGRADDTAESIEQRWQIYQTETAEVINYYRQKGLVKDVDGQGPIDVVSQRLEQALGLASAA